MRGATNHRRRGPVGVRRRTRPADGDASRGCRSAAPSRSHHDRTGAKPLPMSTTSDEAPRRRCRRWLRRPVRTGHPAISCYNIHPDDHDRSHTWACSVGSGVRRGPVRDGRAADGKAAADHGRGLPTDPCTSGSRPTPRVLPPAMSFKRPTSMIQSADRPARRPAPVRCRMRDRTDVMMASACLQAGPFHVKRRTPLPRTAGA
jgi:hypothetical protein